MPGQADWERLIRAQRSSGGRHGTARNLTDYLDWQRKLNAAGAGGWLGAGGLADLRSKIMVIDGIKATVQPWVFLPINSPLPNFEPPSILRAQDSP